MPIEITMPKLSDTMEEGTILRWYKREGERVEKGEVFAEVETDKADMELEADEGGIVREIRVKEGDAAAVGTVIAVLAEAGEDARAGVPEAAAGLPGAAASAAQAEAREPASPPAAPVVASVRTRQRSTPTPQRPVPPPAAPPQVPSGPQTESKLRLTVAKQMAAAKREVPHFYVTCEIEMSEAARMRAALAQRAVAERITFTHLLIRALALALQRHPRVNASWSEEGVTFHPYVSIGVAVALEDGLIAPVLRGCQNLSLRAIARATSELVAKAQAGRFAGDELTGATFTLSNLGMLDIEAFSAVIIPPQAAILAVGSIKDRPVVRDGQLAVAKTMRVSLSADHRVLNGMEAGRFLEDLKTVLENPVLLVLGDESV
jgi:pyruvate dehydrogenase E2 component (dihydrolipoamide acetyltransferase)